MPAFADRAAAWGLANRVVEPEQLLAESRELARQVLTAIPHMLVSYKQLINEGSGMQLPDAIALERKRGLAAARGMDITAMKRGRHEALARGARERKAD